MNQVFSTAVRRPLLGPAQPAASRLNEAIVLGDLITTM
jgi:hypothetical protein